MIARTVIRYYGYHTYPAGFLLALLYCFISGFAGVYLEYLMKRPTEQFNSFHFQNVQVRTLLCSTLPPH
jgi:hypothetical protein